MTVVRGEKALVARRAGRYASPVVSLQKGSIGLFRFAGIQVYLHWSWFLVAAYSVSERRDRYHELFYALAEYLVLFAIVLMHEFGHSLACRQVGGRSEQIVLWPLGGIAFVQPPHRPGAMLWSIAAGPLVNLVLVPVMWVFWSWCEITGLAATSPDLPHFGAAVFWINAGLLIFNLMPVYPLDGGQIVQSILWYFVGYARSLFVASLLGFVGVAGIVALSFYLDPGSLWTIVIAVFLGSRCWHTFKHARERLAFERRPRNTLYACPACHASPLDGLAIKCGACGQPFEPYASGGRCPACGAVHPDIRCLDCGEMRPIEAWRR
jgi:Zn-dependent protease